MRMSSVQICFIRDDKHSYKAFVPKHLYQALISVRMLQTHIQPLIYSGHMRSDAFRCSYKAFRCLLSVRMLQNHIQSLIYSRHMHSDDHISLLMLISSLQICFTLHQTISTRTKLCI